MNINQILPFVSTIIMLAFTISVFRRWLIRRQPHFLFWSLGLGMFGAGSFAESYFVILGWNSVIFFIWYLFGAVLNAGWIGHGTLLLLVRRRWTQILTGLLIVGSLVAAILMVLVMSRLDPSGFISSLPISEQYRDILPEVRDGAWVRLSTPFFNIYGLVTIVGGALWSAWLFLRKRVLPNRVIGNVLIAAGALSIGFASTLTRLGYGGYLYLGELVAAAFMYAGFLMAARPAEVPEPEPAPEPSRSV